MPLDRPVVLSVGAVNLYHKRMHYVVEELARLPQPRPFLQIVGAADKETPQVVQLAERLLGPKGYSVRSVKYEQVFDYYRAADIFVLGSLQEGFGRVYIEALMHGLPVIAHAHPVMQYVLGPHGVFGDLNLPGTLADLLARELRRPPNDRARRARWESVENRFSWSNLASQYEAMFRTVFERSRSAVHLEQAA